MKPTAFLLAAACVPALALAQDKKPAAPAKPAAKPTPAAPAPATPAPTPGAPKPPEPELSPAEAKKRLSLALGTFFANRQKATPTPEKINYDSLAKGLSQVLSSKDPSFALGAQFAGQLVHDGIEVTAADLAAAFKAVMEGDKALLTPEEVNAEVQKLQARLNQKRQEARRQEAAKNEEMGKAFLEKNRTAEGVQVTESGLQYKVLEPAKDPNAPKPTADDRVACNYRGTLIDGTEFDKSPEGQPGTFSLRGVVKGWTEGIPLMQVGSKYRFWIPANLAYGDNPRPGGVIKPGSTLIFDVELVRIEPRTASTPPAPGQAVSQPIKIDRGEKAVATTPPIAVEMVDGKPVVRQVTPEQEAAAKAKAAAEAAKKAAEGKPAETPPAAPAGKK